MKRAKKICVGVQVYEQPERLFATMASLRAKHQ
jgi:hypothetical protein